MSKRNRKNGYSLVEVVIALSVIVLVSVCALSIMLSSVTTRLNAVNKSRALCFADNVCESFKVAETHDEFLSLVEFAETVSLGEGLTDEGGRTRYVYNSEENNFIAEISVKFSNEETDEFAISVTGVRGDELVSFSYRKGNGV